MSSKSLIHGPAPCYSFSFYPRKAQYEEIRQGAMRENGFILGYGEAPVWLSDVSSSQFFCRVEVIDKP